MTAQKLNISYCEELRKLGFNGGEIEIIASDSRWRKNIQRILLNNDYRLILSKLSTHDNRIECELKLSVPCIQQSGETFSANGKKTIKTFSFKIQSTGNTTEAILGQACKEQIFEIENRIDNYPDLCTTRIEII